MNEGRSPEELAAALIAADEERKRRRRETVRNYMYDTHGVVSACLPLEEKQRFRAACAAAGISMHKAICGFVAEFLGYLNAAPPIEAPPIEAPPIEAPPIEAPPISQSAFASPPMII